MKKNSNDQLKEAVVTAQNFPNTAIAGLGLRYQSSAVELAQDAERQERQGRLEALRLAASLGEPPEDVARRAEVYFAFLRR